MTKSPSLTAKEVIPVPQTGKQYTMQDVNQIAGDTALILRNQLINATSFKEFLERTPDADLVALGFLQEQVDILKGAYVGEINQLVTAFDAFIWTKRLLGPGI